MQTRTQWGLTLIEMLVFMAILAIILQVALPAWQDFIMKNRSQALQHSIERAVQLSRSQAVISKTNVELCGSQDQHTCSNDWSDGWVIRVQSLNGQPGQPSHVHTLDRRHLQLQWAGFRPKIVFNANGYSSSSNGLFFVCRDVKIDWQLILNRQGRLRRGQLQENRDHAHRCAA